MNTYYIGLIIAILSVFVSPLKAQIGYQVALINNATGEPRSFETVNVDLTISDNTGATIYNGSQSATTNDFGILSLSVGDGNTFKNVDWSKLPFYISATVDGVLIGKTQILSVPVAEYAKETGALTVEKLCSKKYICNYTTESDTYVSYEYKFDKDFTVESQFYNKDYGVIFESNSKKGKWYKDGNFITVVFDHNAYTYKYIPDLDAIEMDGILLK